jgi:SAM-dependent methyltransferase
MSYITVSSHRMMALDVVRNDAYAHALQQVIRPDSIVLDLGAGTGIHGLMAARLGARRVYLVEQEDIIALADENIRANGLQDVVRSFHGRIEDVHLPESVDVIVSVLTGNFLLTEDLLPSLLYARDRFLKPGGRLIPSEAAMVIAPVSAPSLHEKEIACWSALQLDVDLSPARPYSANTVFFRNQELEEARDLAEPAVVHALDFAHGDYAPLKVDVSVTITQSGICHGWAGWFTMKLADRWLSTSPRDKRTHWSQAFLPLDPPVTVEQGEQVQFHLARAPYGDWVWGMKATAGAQRHATLFSAPMKATTVHKASLDYQPVLSDEGQAVAYVLSHCNGGVTASQIAQSLRARYPERYRTTAEALHFVQAIVKRHA